MASLSCYHCSIEYAMCDHNAWRAAEQAHPTNNSGLLAWAVRFMGRYDRGIVVLIEVTSRRAFYHSHKQTFYTRKHNAPGHCAADCVALQPASERGLHRCA